MSNEQPGSSGGEASMMKHIKSVDIGYQCTLCSSTFTHKHLLIEHKNIIHPLDERRKELKRSLIQPKPYPSYNDNKAAELTTRYQHAYFTYRQIKATHTKVQGNINAKVKREPADSTTETPQPLIIKHKPRYSDNEAEPMSHN